MLVPLLWGNQLGKTDALHARDTLARALFFTARRGQPVREELFSAVATILAFVMSFDSPDPEGAPAVHVPPAFDFDERGERRKPGGQ